MKSNGQMNHGGQLLPQCRAAWAQCFVRFIQAYAAEGVPIWGVTVQNEPEATQVWDSCLYTAEEERDFVRDHLWPVLDAAGLGHVKIHSRHVSVSQALQGLDVGLEPLDDHRLAVWFCKLCLGQIDLETQKFRSVTSSDPTPEPNSEET